ncbi:hypothetical protein IPA_05955 [Ignicoccus pacificus DSM 13166]|uniref:ABC transporter domain-containing protein n=1 Tax=Ignicoccus pacificus DSM 13166 TaxID=940294 RepID=A0A977PKZ5_9CREN|nr:hypothetical protein IPA_05955 [Ignicoccus pacificus DSM 13166]
MSDLRYSYKNKEVLKGISFKLAKGERLVIVGPNGAGKSTLLKVLIGARKGEGRIVMCDLVVQDEKIFIPIEKRCAAYVPQGSGVFPHKTVLENLRIAGKERDESELVEMARVLGLRELDVKAGKLSGGQKRRLAIAMALVSNKKIILLDEPLGAVDPASRGEIVDVIKEHTRDRGVVWVTHLKDVVERVGGRVCKMEGGKLLDCEEEL